VSLNKEKDCRKERYLLCCNMAKDKRDSRMIFVDKVFLNCSIVMFSGSVYNMFIFSYSHCFGEFMTQCYNFSQSKMCSTDV
jgi:hypothetical protein